MTTSSFLPVAGVRLGTTCSGSKYQNRDDLLVIALAAGSSVAGVFTQNAFCAAPVELARAHLKSHPIRYWLINAGNANAGTGEQGMQDAISCCLTMAEVAGCDTEAVLPFSTGVVGELMPVEALQAAIAPAFENIDETNWLAAAAAIMTTDTVPKLVSVQFEVNGAQGSITGIAKGSGMIRPNMATMLSYVATDISVPQDILQSCLETAMVNSFNSITIDGDTSTNDACMLAATGQQSAIQVTETDSEAGQAFQQALNDVCEQLAQGIVRDGEGATKLITIKVEEGKTIEECRAVAFSIAHSPLVKTAFFASDANWGRILVAVGYADIDSLDVSKIRIYLDDVCIVENGRRAPDYTEEQGTAVMQQSEITVRVVLARGVQQARVWTCDLSHDYVRINAEYRT
ncbi:MAG: bifunctional glutamate N-acetyltransferase/amino-acid acetyltransferase ArgJ [Pseudomonadota bacterium]